MTNLTCWTGDSLDVQPVLRSVHAEQESHIELTLLVGTWNPGSATPTVDVELECWVGGRWQAQAGPISCTQLPPNPAPDDYTPDGYPTDFEWLEARRHSTDARAHLTSDDAHYIPGNRYWQLNFTDLPVGALARVAATASLAGSGLTATARTALWLVAPQFDHSDLLESRTTRRLAGPAPRTLPGEKPVEDPLPDEQCWVLFARPGEDGFDHVRLDMLTTSDVADHQAIAPIGLQLDDGPVVDVSARAAFDWDSATPEDYLRPIIDRSTDSVLLSAPHRVDPPLRAITVTTGRGEVQDTHTVSLAPADVDQDYGYRPTALMLIQYCIQGMNDLFAPPVMAYPQPRNYIEIAYTDELGRYSSSPNNLKDGIKDGYRFALEVQRDYRVKSQWAFNGGVLTLMQHGLRADEWKQVREQVATGLISPSNAGFGAHRPPYYRAETNERELRLGEQIIQAALGRGSDGTYYPDQRIYLATAGEADTYRTLREQDQLRYIVFDRSTVAVRELGVDLCPFANDRGTRYDGNYIWREDRTGLNVLLIEDELRDELLNQCQEERFKGQLKCTLRRRLMDAVRFAKPGPSQLFVYGDDLDHACGNGWFDGTTIEYTRGYLAALCWIRNHPWVRAWTVDEKGFDPTLYQPRTPITVSSAICPSVDPGGVESIDKQGNTIHFNTWYQQWAQLAPLWFGRPLGAMSDALEADLIDWPQNSRNELYELAWMYFLACTHESMWSKQPLNPDPNKDPNPSTPEDFVVSESIQQRNAWVYLNASLWATWARSAAADDSMYVIDSTAGHAGPLLSPLRQRHSADAYWQDPPTGDAAYWDHDCLPTIVLYNRRALVVVDRNGGRITHIFCRPEGTGVPISVSGTLKAYQFLTPEVDGSPQRACDGVKLQNTVFAPNHAYVGTDVDQAMWVEGTYIDPRFGSQPGWYPDNFDAYDCDVRSDGAGPIVTCRYGPAQGEQPIYPITADQFDCVCKKDGLARRTGQPGIVWHNGEDFHKTIRLDGTRIEIRYSGVRPGHVVANEFTVDLRRAVLCGVGQRRTTSSSNRSAMVENDEGLRVSLLLGANCDFAPAQQTVAASGDGATSYDGLHRVLTDDVRLVCAAGGDFGYDIVLPG
jgi:hypothetical protein